MFCFSSIPRCLRITFACLVTFVIGSNISPHLVRALDAEVEVAKALAKKSSFDFLNAPLHSVPKKLSDKFGIRVRLDASALDEIGIDHGTPVTCQFSNISLRAALSLMLEPVGLTHIEQDGWLSITTSERAEEHLELRCYPVGDLVATESDGDRRLDFDPLIELMATVIQPESWSDLGGNGTIIGFAPSEAIVAFQTQKIHRQISSLLASLRNVPCESQDLDSQVAPAESFQRVAVKTNTDRKSIQLADKSLSSAVAMLAKEFDVQIAIERQSLEEIGIDINGAINDDLRDGTLSDAVVQILEPMGLRVISKHEVLLVTTMERSESELVTRVYPVEKLTTCRAVDGTVRQDSDPLIGLIHSTIQPESWEDLGGAGSIVTFPARHCLVVSQTNEGQRGIEELLSELRRLRRERPDGAGAASDKTTFEVYNVTVTGIESNKLLEVITELVEPASWEISNDVYIKPLPGRLLIRHQPRTHKEIRDLMRKLEPNDAQGVF